jgi:DNA-binding winged helix-turn-helix (wHTH) protein/tetratricopeptide (TPR) repeat protein/TolB-like protein
MTVATPPERRLYQFDEFLVDPLRRLLLRDGEPVAVTPKALSVLLVLVEQPGAVVEKSELIRKVWPDTNVSEANLTQNVSFLRKALGERANDPRDRRYVVTVPGQGYRFVGEVRALPPPEILPAEPLPDESPPPAPREESGARPIVAMAAVPPVLPSPGQARRSPRRIAAIVAYALLAALGVAGAAWWAAGRKAWQQPAAGRPGAAAAAAAGPSRPAVAVLGFKDLSGSPKARWLAPALSETLITELTAGQSLRVLSGENVARARRALALPYSESGEGYDLARVRSFLGADLAVVGSYAFLGSGADPQIRLTVRVLKLPEGVAVTSLVETGTESGLFDLVSRTGKDLRRNLGLAELSPEEARAAQALHPASPDAARLYTQGLALLRSYDILAARDRLVQAAQADPGSPLIHSALSQAWAQLGYDARARAEAQKALELATLLSREERLELEARFQAAGRKWGQASEVYRSLWTFFPDDLEYGLRLVNALDQAGRDKEALALVALLRRLPPPACDDPRIDLEEATAARRLPDNATLERAAADAVAKGRRLGEPLVVAEALMLQGSVPLFTGRPREALGPFREAYDLYRKAGYRLGVAMAKGHIGLAFYRNGDFAEAERAYLEAVKISQEIGNAMGIAAGLSNLGFLYQSQGDLVQALAISERARAQYVEIEDPVYEGRVLHAIATIHLAQGDLAAARGESEQVLVTSRQTGDRADEARALGNLGMILALQGSLAEARETLDKALGTLRELRDPNFATPLLVESVDVLGRLGDIAGARSRGEQGLAAARQEKNRINTAKILGALSRLSLRAGDPAAARRQAEEQLRIGREIGARNLTAWALQNLGRAALAAGAPGDIEAARRAFQESLEKSKESGETLRWTVTRLDLARLSLAGGNPGAAARIAREAAAWLGSREIRAEETRALSILAVALLQEGRPAEAQEATGKARAQAAESDDKELRSEVAARLAANAGTS